MTTYQLTLCYSLLDASNIKRIAISSNCTIQFVRAVLRGERNNSDILQAAYDHAKDKAYKMIVECNIIEKKNSNSLSNIPKHG